MSSLQLYHQNKKILIFSSKIVGAEVWTSTQMLTPSSYVLLLQMAVYFYSNFWTAYHYRDDIIMGMKVLNCTGIAIQLSAKFFIAIFRKKDFLALCVLIENELYQKYVTTAELEGRILLDYAKIYHILLRVIMFLYFASLFVFGLYPLYIFLNQGEIIPLFMFEIPYVDWHTTGGLIATYAVQVITYVTGIFGIIMADGLFIHYVVHAIVFMEIFEIHLHQLGILLQNQDQDDEGSETANRWKQCLREHQQISQFTSEVESFSGMLCLILVFTSVFAICDNIILTAVTDWYASILFLFVCFVQLTIYFTIGNMIERKFDSMDLSIMQFPWYLLNISQRKEYSFVVNRMQSPMILTICGFSPLNFESYMAILKALYQFVMMIFNFVA